MEFDENVVERIRAVPGNTICADCRQPDPEWASINIGVAICVNCSGAHRSLGTHVSQVRSIKLDNWTDETLRKMEAEGNDKVNVKLEHFVPSHIPKPSEYPESDCLRKKYIHMKYAERAFVTLRDEEEEKRALSHKEGFMLKQSKNDANKWQKRWLVLSEGALAYYRGADSQAPKGVVRIGQTAIFGLPSPHEITVSSGLGHREYHFKSTSSEEVIDWLIALRASMSADGRGSLVRRALGSTIDGDMTDDGNDERPPRSDELTRDAFRQFGDGHNSKHGWLLKRSSVGNGMMHVWSKRYFVLIPEGAIYYFRSLFIPGGKWRDPMGAMSIVGASIETDNSKPYAIVVRCPEGQLLLAAESEEDRTAWITALKSAAEAHATPAN